MTLWKKLSLLCTAVLLCGGMSIAAVACVDTNVSSTPEESTSSTDEESSDGEDDGGEDTVPTEYVYRVTVKNAGGYGFGDVDVSLYNGTTLVATATTHDSGAAYFEESDGVSAGKYTVKVSGYPTGYTVMGDSYTTIELAGTDVDVVIQPGGVLSGEAPSGTRYKLGDIVHDFTVTDTDNKKVTLSEVLKEKQLMVLNFWATWCGPCKSEFPALQNSLIAYSDTVSCVAISVTDPKSEVAKFKGENGYTFSMAEAGAGGLAPLFGMVGSVSVPRTLMIDRYGVVVFDHTGGIDSLSDWAASFEYFVGEDYLPYVIGNTADVNPDGDGTDTPVMVVPNVNAPALSDVAATLGVGSEFTFRWQEKGVTEEDEEYDKYNWPWVTAKENGVPYLYASNRAVNNSYAILYADYTPQEDEVLVFDYKIGTEESCDYFYLMVDGYPVKKVSGNHFTEWSTCYGYVFQDYEAGKSHEIAFAFQKDSDSASYDDIVQIKNLRVIDKSDIPPDAGSNAHVLMEAATNPYPSTVENAPAQFQNYVSTVYSTVDGYYHVGSENGPILFANLWYASSWNATSVWNLAYNDYFVDFGYNYKPHIESYAWEANQPTEMWGYTPVTKDLKELLVLLTEVVDYGTLWNGAWHENEWLELCCYYQHYGDEAYEDPMKGITFSGAIEMKEGSNTVEVPFAINPRGFKYKFTPAAGRGGVYRVYSTGESNTVVFLIAEDRSTMLGTWDNKLFVEITKDEQGNDTTDENFEFCWTFEEGKTYYLLFTTYLDQVATYNVEIEYLGRSYTYLDNAAIGPYSINTVTQELFLPDAIDYVLADDGYYHERKPDGSLGGIIYLDVSRPTPLLTGYSLYNILYSALKPGSTVAVENRLFYINGTDYTEELMDDYVYPAHNATGSKKGFVAVDARLFEILNALTLSSKYEGVKDSWLLLCYYEKTIGIVE